LSPYSWLTWAGSPVTEQRSKARAIAHSASHLCKQLRRIGDSKNATYRLVTGVEGVEGGFNSSSNNEPPTIERDV